MGTKGKWWIWAMVLLLLTNAAMMGTLLYRNYHQDKQVDSSGTQRAYGVNAINGRFFRQTLGFTPEQMDEFRQANQQFRPQTMWLTSGIDSLKAAMFREMNKPQPDTQQLNQLSREIGNRHGALKRETYQFYLKVRAVCSPQQQQQLEKEFEPLFVNENLPVPGPGYPRGWHKANH